MLETEALQSTSLLETKMTKTKTKTKTNFVAFSPKENRLIDRHLSTKFSANVCG
jgi:hypothetical protein